MILNQLKSNLLQAGIQKGDRLCVFSDLQAIGIPEEARALVQRHGISALLESYLETLKDVVGESGALFMPAFTYSACRGEVFAPKVTPSTVGALTEYFRTQPDTRRSAHPIFSFCGWGRMAPVLLETSSWDCFGESSYFQKMIDSQGKYLLLGTTLQNSATFVYHALQAQGVSYRYFKSFTGQIALEDEVQTVEVPYFVRNLETPYSDSWGEAQAQAIEAGVLKRLAYASGTLLVTGAAEIDSYLQNHLKKNPLSLVSAAQ